MTAGGVILGLDLATRLTGYCVGNGRAHPTASAWRWPHVEDDLGMLGALVRSDLTPLIRGHGVTHVIYEKPILVVAPGADAPDLDTPAVWKGRRGGKQRRPGQRTDNLATIRKLYCLGGFVELVCRDLGVVCQEEDLGRVKKELTGDRHADKDRMVAAALACGIELPETLAAGQRDAADAFACWLVGVRLHTEFKVATAWDQRVYRARGGLL